MPIHNGRALIKICNVEGKQKLIERDHVLFGLITFLCAMNKFSD